MVDLAPGWKMDVDRGPDWIFLKLHPPAGAALESVPLAEHLWNTMQQHFTHRMVLEMDNVTLLQSYLIGQLVLLNKRIHTAGGLLRICGLSPHAQEVLHQCRLSGVFPCYNNREAAVMGYRPTQPR